MTLTELFLPQTNQEFPPPHVFAYVDGEPKMLSVKELPEYETMYAYEGNGFSVKSDIYNKAVNGWTLPVLVPKVML